MAHAQAIMLSNDFYALFEESWDTMRILLVMQHVQSLQRAMATSDRMAEYSAELKMEIELNKDKLALADVDQLKADLATIEQARDASYAATTQAQEKASTAKVALA